MSEEDSKIEFDELSALHTCIDSQAHVIMILRSKIERLQRRMAEIHQQDDVIAAQYETIANKNSEIDNLQQQIKMKEKDIETLHATIQNKCDSYRELEAQYASLHEKVGSFIKKFMQSYDDVGLTRNGKS
jgi:uncharacterized protein (DUF3084 family)